MSGTTNRAEIAAIQASERVFNCIQQNKSFVLEAGAGAGKTHSLVQVLIHLIDTRGKHLLRLNQKIACITYTNVAKKEIEDRIDRHPVVLTETIHTFCWSMIKDFQSQMRAVLPSIGKWAERIEKQGEIGRKPIEYSLGYPKIEEEKVSLHHDDVIRLMVALLEEPKFRVLFSKKYPVLLIDEYQDTNIHFVDSLKKYFIETEQGPLIGFFGDHWQKIYGSSSCGKIEHSNLEQIGKGANFRSERVIVESLNRMRPDLTQEFADPDSAGSVVVFHTNEWCGTRQKGAQWKDDLPSDVARVYVNLVRKRLTEDHWDFTPEKTKTLMLTHKVLADEQGYRNLADAVDDNDRLTKKEDPYLTFFQDILEPVAIAYEQRRFGEMFDVLGRNTPKIHKHADKTVWVDAMNKLLTLRETGTIGEVIEHLKEVKRPRLPENIIESEQRVADLSGKHGDDVSNNDESFIERVRNMKAVQYYEVTALIKFLENQTPFATNHSVKGAQFENVLVVCGRGWNQYNFGQMLEMVNDERERTSKQDSFERNLNLFYVACSRPKKRLAILFTQKLSESALYTLQHWFGAETIQSLPHIDT